MKEFNNNLIKYNFNIKQIKLFDSFAGIGALHQSLKELGVPVNLVGISEIDVDAIISYVAVHKIDISKIKPLEIQEMKDYLISRNIGYDFKKNKSSIPRMKKDKLELLYKCCIATNNLGDISLINPNNIPDFDLFNMTFPCTDLSISGKQQGMKDKEGNITRSGLYIYGIEIIKHKKPKYIMIENVKNLIGKKFINDFYNIINEIESYGYKCYYPKKDNDKPTCLNAKDYGIPQNRERIYVICVRNDVNKGNFNFPKGFDSGLRLKNLLEDEVDEKYYLTKEIQDRFKRNDNKDINRNELNIMGTTKSESISKNSFIDKYGRIQPFETKENYIQWNTSGKESNSQQDRAYYQDKLSPILSCCNANGDKSQVILADKKDIGQFSNSSKMQNNQKEFLEILNPNKGETYINKLSQIGTLKGGKWDKINESCKRVYNSNNISPTIHTCGGGNTEPKICDYNTNNITNSFKIRKLTPKECWRLMGFRDECFGRAKAQGISDSQLYKQAGNSIVVNVLYYIFKELFKEHIINDN